MLSKDLETTLNNAFREARGKRHEFMTVEHLLLALLDNAAARSVLRAVGADIDRLRSELAQFIESTTPVLPEDARERETQPTLGIQRVLQRLSENPGRPLAVALGSASIASEEFRKELLTQLEAAGPSASNLWIGISEHTIRHHRTAVGLLVRALVRLQIPVLVDRFGVGGVPFSYLRNLSVQALRIDNSFIHDIDTHEENRFYLESVVSIAHSRGVKVFATGVETAAEYAELCKLGIDGAMGYHLGRPFAADHQPTGE